jgi:hypothetical protein
MLSQETDHVSPTEVTPELGKEALDTWRPLGRIAAGLIKPAVTQIRLRRRGCGQTGMAGVHTNQRLNLSKPWEGPRKICRGFKPDPGNLAVRHYRGASGTVRHGENVNPSRNRKSGRGNPSPTARRAQFLSRPTSPRTASMLPCVQVVRVSSLRVLAPDSTTSWAASRC